MSKLSQTMKMVSGSTTYTIPFYTTTAEAGAYGTYGNANVGGTECYYCLGTGAAVATGSGIKTPLKVVKSSTTYYMLAVSTFTLTLAATTNQTITLKYTEPGGSQVTKTSTTSAQALTVKYGTTWTATLAAATGYNAGTLSASSGTVTAATTVSATAATIKTFTVTVEVPSDGTIEVNNIAATSSNNTFTFDYNTSVTIQATANSGYQVDSLEVT